jgi:sugar phosphate isomerase/epimerase
MRDTGKFHGLQGAEPNTLNRREAGRLLAAGALATAAGGRLFAADRINSTIRGVTVGAQSYSFRDRPLDAAIEAYRTIGLGEAELWQGHVEPQKASEKELRRWRETTPDSTFHDIRTKFDRAGVLLYAYNYSFRKEMSDAEIRRGFEMAQAMGVKYITASANVSVAPRVDAEARKFRIMVGFHGHDDTSNPDEFSTAATFARAMQGASRYIGVNLDIGHFVAAGGDPVAYIREHHDRIVTLHIKDRKKNHGANLPFGEGDTPIVAVLRLLRDRKYRIPANIEYEYGDEHPGLDTIVEVKKCYAYCRTALET